MNNIGLAYPAGPYEYSRAWDFRVDFATDPKVANALLPDALTPDPEARAWVRSSCHRTSSFGPYTGAYIGLHAQHEGKPVSYIVTGIKTDFLGTVAAREIWGLPYLLGQVEASWTGSLFSCTIKGYTGEQLAHVMLHTTRRETEPAAGVPAYYSADVRDHCGNVLRTELLSAQNSYNLEGAEAWTATASLQLPQASSMNDWSRIPVREVLSAQYRTGGQSTLGMATVIAQG